MTQSDFMNLRNKIIKLSENNLRKKIIIPLLNALGAYGTEDFHGPREKGKDVYFSYKNLFGRNKHCCFFIKKGNIKKTGRNDIRNMKGAIEEAIKSEFTNPIDNKTPVRIEEFYFVCSGKINQEAREWLTEFLVKQSNFPNLDVFDIDSLIQLILDLIKKFNDKIGENYNFNTSTFSAYCDKIINYSNNTYTISDISISNSSEGDIIQN